MEDKNKLENKVFNDPVHNSVQMPPYCQMIIDTPEFQRLRYIKQLGCTCHVFPSAVHTRFEHSIGVSHLAGKLAKMLQQDENNHIQKNEVICVEIAGLCHDLGHGPFLHAFENLITEKNRKKWTHTEQSVIIFEYLIKKNNLEQKLADQHSIIQLDIEFICELILGRPRKKGAKLQRGNKFFLHQIVNNSANKVDVNKWDYFARDTLYLGMKSAFDFNRIVPFIKVLEVQRDGQTRKELCFRDKVANDLNHMFLTRRRLHYAAYQHRVTKIISIMLKDAFQAAGMYLQFVGQNGTEKNLFETVEDPAAFCQVDDTIINEIMRSRSQEPGVMKAREIIERIHKRQLYQCIGEYHHSDEEPIHKHTLDRVEIKKLMADDRNEEKLWHSENIEVEVSSFDYGDDDQNPLLHIPFYNKSNGKMGTFLPKEKLPVDLSQRLQDVTVTVYTKVPNAKRETLQDARNKGNEKLETVIAEIVSRSRQDAASTGRSTGTVSHQKSNLDKTMATEDVVNAYFEENKDRYIYGSKVKESQFIDLREQNAKICTYGEITVEKLTEAPPDLPLQDDEVVISYGLEIASHGSELSTSVTIMMPHCAIFDDPQKAEIVLYTRDNGSGKFTTLSSANEGTPRYVVGEKDLELRMNHFSLWWIVAKIRSHFIGKRMICTPYVPERFRRNQVNCIYMFLKDDLWSTEEHPEDFRKAFAKEQFNVKWRKGNVKIRCFENDVEIATKVLTVQQLKRRNYQHISFRLEARDTSEPRATFTFKLEQSNNTNEIQFTTDFEVSMPTQSSQDPTSPQADAVPPESQQRNSQIDGVPEMVLWEIAEAIGNHRDLPRLALGLGFSIDRWSQYSASNTGRDGNVCSTGTFNMLMDWKKKTAGQKQIPGLKNALIEAQYVALAEKHFGIP